MNSTTMMFTLTSMPQAPHPAAGITTSLAERSNIGNICSAKPTAAHHKYLAVCEGAEQQQISLLHHCCKPAAFTVGLQTTSCRYLFSIPSGKHACRASHVASECSCFSIVMHVQQAQLELATCVPCPSNLQCSLMTGTKCIWNTASPETLLKHTVKWTAPLLTCYEHLRVDSAWV